MNRARASPIGKPAQPIDAACARRMTNTKGTAGVYQLFMLSGQIYAGMDGSYSRR